MVDADTTSSADSGGSGLKSADDATVLQTSRRWYVLAVLTVVATLNTIDRNLVPALAEPIRAEFGLNDTQFGFLAGMVFAVAYSVIGVPIGLLVDRMNRVRLLATLQGFWSGATIAGGLAASFTGLIFARMAVAGAESGGNPTSVSLISDYFPRNRRATAIGFYFSHGALALFIVFSLAGVIAANYGWRAAFLMAGIPGLVFSVLVLLTLMDPGRGMFEPAPVADTRKAGLGEILRIMATNRILRPLGLAAILTIVGQTGISAFLTAFYIRVHDLSLAQAGLIVGLILGGASGFGTPVGGFLADLLSRKSTSSGCYFVAAVTVLSIPLAILGLTVSALMVSIAFLFLYKVLISSFYGATLSTCVEASPVNVRGSVMTYLLVAMNLVGYGFGPQISGILSDLYNNAGLADPLRWALVTVTATFGFSGAMYVQAGRSLQCFSRHGPSE